MKYSMMSYTMGRRRDLFSVKKMFELTVELKMDGIDLVGLHGEKPEELRKIADDHGVPVVCHTFGPPLNFPDSTSRQPGVDMVKKGIEDAQILGAKIIMLVTPGKEEIEREQSTNNWIEALKEVAPLFDEAGITVTIENFPGAKSPYIIASDFLKTQKEVPNLRLTYDCGNAVTGEDPTYSFKQCAQYVVHAHFKDSDIREQAEEGFKKMLDGRYYRPALIGEGTIDFKSVVGAMKEANYQGCINIEYEGNKYTPEEGVRKALDYLRKIEDEC